MAEHVRAGAEGTWRWRDWNLTYEVHGEGPRTFVFIHGLLLPASCNRALAREISTYGYRVILPELLGHGRSDRPRHASEHRLELFADQILTLLDVLELEETVLGGVSLGANVTLELAAAHPERLRGAILEMPVLERGGAAAAPLFVSLMLALRGLPLTSRTVAAVMRRLPRTGTDALDAFLDSASGDPRANAAVIHGMVAGPIAPPLTVRCGIDVPSLVIGHPRDLLHPLDDALMLSREMPDARLLRAHSITEARVRPERVAAEIAGFLAERWRLRAAGLPRTAT